MAWELMDAALAQRQRGWLLAQRAAAFELEDRYEEALAAAQAALALKPDSRAAIQYTARYLSLFERDDEAMELA